MSDYPNPDLTPIGAGADPVPVVPCDFREQSPLLEADSARKGDPVAIGRHDNGRLSYVPQTPPFQSQARESIRTQENPELPTTILERKGFGATDGDWDDVRGR